MSCSQQKQCACKGIRTCLLCEQESQQIKDLITPKEVYTYCLECQKAWSGLGQPHSRHEGDSIDFPGIFILEEFVSTQEEEEIMAEIYKTPFVESQSGRRKQDFGPKVNFKRKKVKDHVFSGLPQFSKELYERMVKLPILSDFVPVEQCHLEYTPERGSAIDPHFDDFWLWGERLVTVNLAGDTVLYFICEEQPSIEVRVPMLRKSLIVVYGDARTVWKHGIHRSDITSTRLAVTLRELSAEFSEGGERWTQGKALLDTALTFNGRAVGI